jgi:transposase InsO family protein
MVTDMNDTELHSLEQVRGFLDGTEAVAFHLSGKDERYAWTEHTLRRFHYPTLGKAERGVLRRYLERVSGLSRAQITRLVRQYLQHGRVRRAQRTARPFRTRYTQGDVRALAELDERHGTLSGPATKKLCERAFALFGERRYERLATISVAHLYTLRQRPAYTGRRRHFEKTRPTRVAIGQRRKPQPNGQPGFIRLDTVHQGDLDRIKGVYHINAVDEVTQFQLVLSTERIAERYLLPVLEELLDTFPFLVQGFHADNGSEFINHRVAKLLNKLLIELTKSRPRHANDNALAETKNGAVVRKHLGYAHIAQRWAPTLNVFHREHFNPYINFHRPCFFPRLVTDAKGRERRHYPYEAMMTPYDKLKSLPNAAHHLKPGVTFEHLDALAHRISDNDAAEQLQRAKHLLFKTIFEPRTRVA